jgi:uncharacterized protein (TIGR04255 family)
MCDYVKIEPAPLLEVSAEIRFGRKKDVLVEKLISQAYDICADLGATAPAETLMASYVPMPVRDSDPNLRDQPLYRFRLDESTLVVIGSNVVGIGSTPKYSGWRSFSDKLDKLFTQFLDSGLIAEINRIGLRYVNHFKGDIINNKDSNIVAKVKRDDATARNVVLQTILPCDNDFVAQVVLANNSAVINPQQEAVTGSLMDTDVFRRYDNPIQVEINTSRKMVELFNLAHKNNKRLILDIVSEQYLNSNGYTIHWSEQ